MPTASDRKVLDRRTPQFPAEDALGLVIDAHPRSIRATAQDLVGRASRSRIGVGGRLEAQVKGYRHQGDEEKLSKRTHEQISFLEQAVPPIPAGPGRVALSAL